jgi:hypothetical protein
LGLVGPKLDVKESEMEKNRIRPKKKFNMDLEIDKIAIGPNNPL